MSVTEEDFDLSLLSESDLADDPYPDRPYLLSVLGYSDDSAGQVVRSVEIRTGPEQLGMIFAKYRALQLALADRAAKRARAERVQEMVVEAKLRMIHFANEHLPQAEDPETKRELLFRVRDGLERYQGPSPEDSPQDGIGP